MSEPSDTAFVLDSSAVLAYLRGDGRGALVQRVLRQCADCETQAEITSIDLLEVYAAAAAVDAVSLEELASLIDQLPLRVAPSDRDKVTEAAQLLAEDPGLKPSQAATLLLSREREATLVTADKYLARLSPSLYVGPPEGGDPDPSHESKDKSRE